MCFVDLDFTVICFKLMESNFHVFKENKKEYFMFS